MNVCITPKSPVEFEQYYALRWQVLRQPWQQALGSEQDEYEQQSYHRMIVDENQQVLAVGRLEKVSQYLGQIRFMAVNPQVQKQGLGQQMMAQLELLAQHLGVKEIVLNAREDALGFYTKLGYQLEGFSHLLFNEVKHFRMRKQLSAHHQHQVTEALALQSLWHETMPMSKAMNIEVSYYDRATLLTHCDNDFNRHFNGGLDQIMFTGSIYTLATLTGWGWLYLTLESRQSVENFVLVEANICYHTQIKGVAYACVKAENNTQELIKVGCDNNSRTKISVEIYCGDKVAATFTGVYSALSIK